MSGRNELVDLALYVHHETDAAYRVSDDGKDANAVWLPKSQIELVPDGQPKPGAYTAVVTMPVWLAQDKELI